LGDIAISTITLSELKYGVAKSTHREKNEIALEHFLLPLEILPYDFHAGTVYGDIPAKLESQGLVIGPLDMLIAAHAKALSLTLVTNNVKEFNRVDGLKVENWIS